LQAGDLIAGSNPAGYRKALSETETSRGSAATPGMYTDTHIGLV